MGTVTTYVLALVLAAILIVVDVLCIDISNKKRDYVSPILRDNQNIPKSDQHPPGTSLLNPEWPDLGQNPRKPSHINISIIESLNPSPNETPSRQKAPVNSPWDTPRSKKPSVAQPQPNKPSYASVTFLNNEREDGQMAPPQSGSISPTSNQKNNNSPSVTQSGTRSATNNNPLSPQSGPRSPTKNNPFISQSGPLSPTNNDPPSPQSGSRSPSNNSPPSPLSGSRSPTNNNPFFSQTGPLSHTNNDRPSPQSGSRSSTNSNSSSPQSSTGSSKPNRNNRPSPQSWPRPPANPQSHLKPISASGNKTPETTDTNEGENTRGQETNSREDQELREFSENLLRKEVNSAMNTISVNYQGQTTSRSLKDEAPFPLLSVTNKTFQIPTIELLRPLYDNYILETNQNEFVTPLEREEENKLLDAVVNTQVMRFTRNFLIDKGKIGKDPKEFRDYLKQIWFTMYSRGKGKIGSSGFEHVFLTEIRDGQISGLHNWLYFYEEESRGNADYLGYMKTIEFGNKGSILKYHFKFRNIDKPVGSMFIGTSPEFEMALYTTCFALRANHICPLQLDGKRFIIRTYSMRYRGKDNIGSAFPEI